MCAWIRLSPAEPPSAMFRFRSKHLSTLCPTPTASVSPPPPVRVSGDRMQEGEDYGDLAEEGLFAHPLPSSQEFELCLTQSALVIARFRARSPVQSGGPSTSKCI